MKKLLTALLLTATFTAQAGWDDYNTNMYNGWNNNKDVGGNDNGYYNPNSYQNNTNTQQESVPVPRAYRRGLDDNGYDTNENQPSYRRGL